MNLHQFRFVRETVRRNLNLTAAAKALHTSQPGVSKSILELERELGIEIFLRRGKRLREVTQQGQMVVTAVERILTEVEALKGLSAELAANDQGEIVIAATHTEARSILPVAIARFRQHFPEVRIAVVHGTPEHISELIRKGRVDLALSAGVLSDDADLFSLPGHVRHCVAICPLDHPLAAIKRPSIEDLAQFPLIACDGLFGLASPLEKTFSALGLTPEIVLQSADADVVRTYVGLGLGVGIAADLLPDGLRERGLHGVSLDHVFGASETSLVFRRGTIMREYVFALAELLCSAFSRQTIEQLVHEPRGRAISDPVTLRLAKSQRSPDAAPALKTPAYSATASAL